MSEIGFVVVLFRLINFGIIIALLVYVYLKYILPSLKDGIDETVLYEQNLKDKFVENCKDIENLKNNATIQRATIADLNSKLNIWKAAIEENNKKVLLHRTKVLDNVSLKRGLQSDNISKELEYKSIFEDVIKDVEFEIQNTGSLQKIEYKNKLLELMNAELKNEH